MPRSSALKLVVLCLSFALATGFFQRDGRARSLEEAVLWHGGEALVTREAFKAMSPPERAAGLRFLACS